MTERQRNALAGMLTGDPVYTVSELGWERR
jgi:hypothetical protein